ncbi:MAG: MTH1187 family thiamine-binding protein [Thermodesulfobacteriota bacterium]|nr:MTH1187 family thiamine-binding protein [Thermodesulfobacteriota bacterium]
MPIVQVTVVPLGTGSPGVSEYVAECIKILREEDVDYAPQAMGTVIEGELDKVIGAVMKMHEAPFKKGIKRVITTISIDDRRDEKEAIHSTQSKLKSLMEKI